LGSSRDERRVDFKVKMSKVKVTACGCQWTASGRPMQSSSFDYNIWHQKHWESANQGWWKPRFFTENFRFL